MAPRGIYAGGVSVDPPPLLVLVHGTRMDHTQWESYPQLLPEAEIVPVDLPGHGLRVGESFTADSAVAVIAEAVAGAGPGQPVVLAGHSLGGYMAQVFAVRHPGALRALVLIGASAEPSGPLTVPYRGFARLLPRVGAHRMARIANRVMRCLGADPADLPGPEGYAVLPEAWQAVFEECRAEQLGQVDCPVVLLNGQFDQMRVHARRYAGAARSARVVTVPRASHLLPLTHPEQVAQVLREAVA